MDSVRAQTFPDWDHIIVDDGSGDGTREMVEELAGCDPRIRWIQRVGGKPGANRCRNLGILESHGEFIVFLDSDDLLAPTCLEKRVALMKQNKDLNFAVFEGDCFDERIGDMNRPFIVNRLEGDLDRFLRIEYPWEISSPIWRRRFLGRFRGFDEERLSWQDVDLHIRVLAARPLYVRVNDVDHYVRWQNDVDKTSLRHRSQPEFLRNAERCVGKFTDILLENDLLIWQRMRSLAGMYMQLAMYWVETGDTRTSVTVWQQSRKKRLVSNFIYAIGLCALALMRICPSRLTKRLVNKWRRELQLG